MKFHNYKKKENHREKIQLRRRCRRNRKPELSEHALGTPRWEEATGLVEDVENSARLFRPATDKQ